MRERLGHDDSVLQRIDPELLRDRQQQRRENDQGHEALEHRAHHDRDHNHRRQERAARRGLPPMPAIAVVTPSSVSAHEKIVAALTVKKIMPLSSEALVRHLPEARAG